MPSAVVAGHQLIIVVPRESGRSSSEAQVVLLSLRALILRRSKAAPRAARAATLNTGTPPPRRTPPYDAGWEFEPQLNLKAPPLPPANSETFVVGCLKAGCVTLWGLLGLCRVVLVPSVRV